MKVKPINCTGQLIVILSLLISISSKCFSQSIKPGSLDYLKSSNGFNGIILGSNIGLLSMNDLSYLDDNGYYDADSCILYEYKNYNILRIDNDLSFRALAIKVYKNKIVDIYIFFNRPEGFKVLSKFLAKYGQFTDRPNDYLDIYNWNCSKVKLSLKYQLDLDLGIAVFTCKSIEQEIEMKRKKQLQQVLLTNN
ncbi:MAG: hypothetical protein JWQ54_1441 [Mucilaginibacter sp.]|nr:hypothetical protein [Mucilaginibacter sp.]